MGRVLVLACVVLLAGGVAAFLLFGTGDPEPADAEGVLRAAAGAGGPSLRGIETRPAATEPGPAAATVVGRVLLADRPVVATVEIRLASRSPVRRETAWTEQPSQIEELLSVGVRASPPLASTSSAADGSFSFGDLRPGTYEVSAEVPERAVGFAPADVPGPGTVVETVVRIPIGPLSLRGVAVHADGRPFRGWILAQPMAGSSTGAGYATRSGSVCAPTDADGRFRLHGLLHGRTILSAILPGRSRAAAYRLDLPYEPEYRFVVDPGLKEVHGKVVAHDTGKPVAHALVLASSFRPNTIDYVFSRATTDVGGAFSFPQDDGDFSLLVQAEGFAPRRRDVTAPGPVEVRLFRPATVSGAVTSVSTGGAVEGAVVHAEIRGFPPVLATTGPDGRYRLEGVPLGSGRVFLLGGGWASDALAALSGENPLDPFEVVLGPGESRTLDFRAVPAGRVRVRVLSPDGAPLPATVRVDPDGDEWPPSPPAPTDERGVATVADLPPEWWCSAWASAPGHADAARGVRLLADGTAEVEVRMAAPRWVDVLVRGATGEPLPGAQASAEDVLRLTGEDGRARLGPLAEGEVTVTAAATGHLRAAATVPSSEGGRDASLTLDLPGAHAVEGRVEMPEGLPPDEVMFGASSEAGAVESRVRSDGTFRVDGLGPGTVTLHAAVSGNDAFYEATLEVPAGSTGVVLPLAMEEDDDEPGAAPTALRVLLPSGEAPAVVDVRTYHPSEEGTLEVDRDDDAHDGRIEIDASAPVWVEVLNPVDLFGRPVDASPAFLGPIRAGDGEVVVRLEPGLSLDGRAAGPDGRPLAGLLVRATATAPVPGPTGLQEMPGRVHATARTDARGAFRLVGLAPGAYRIDVTAPPGLLAPRLPPVAAGSGDLELRFGAAKRLAVTVLDPEERPVPHASVTFVADGVHERRTTSEDGVARFHYLDPVAVYRVGVQSNREDLVQQYATDAPPDGAAVRLPRGVVLTGTVRDAAGRPRGGGEVLLDSPSHLWTLRAAVGEDGRFELDRLAPGPVRLRAVAGDGEERVESPEVSAVAGGPPVVLVLPE